MQIFTHLFIKQQILGQGRSSEAIIDMLHHCQIACDYVSINRYSVLAQWCIGCVVITNVQGFSKSLDSKNKYILATFRCLYNDVNKLCVHVSGQVFKFLFCLNLRVISSDFYPQNPQNFPSIIFPSYDRSLI